MRIPVGIPQFFFDDTLIADQRRLVRRWLPASVFANPVVEPDRPWEGRIVAMLGAVLPESDGGFRMYYAGFTPGALPFTRSLVCFSEDGFHWRKPELGILDWNGDFANNLVLSPEWHTDSPCVIHDTDDEQFPYKLIAFQCDDPSRFYKSPNCGMYGWKSSDGLRWTKFPGQLLRAGDRSGMMTTKPNGKFSLYTRRYDMFERIGVRAIFRSESDDFVTWTDPELALAPDLNDEPDVEFYGMSVFERNGWYLGLLEYWKRQIDIAEIHLAFSRDGKTWMRPYPRAPFIANACYWNKASMNCANNGPILINEQMVFYFGGRPIAHNYDSAHQYGAIGYASLPIDRFCAIEGAGDGQLTTAPLEWPDAELILNADTRESFASHPLAIDGEITVEVLGAGGDPLPGWNGDQRAIFSGNTHCRCRIFDGTVRWPSGQGLREMRGRTIRLRFHLRHARLFTIEAR
ncbi:MAG: hypothetical protein Q7T82_10850 [Armatimonadota bacterium]|nr:hypothetical protein [Armatimonadota bacterium]